MKLREGVVGGKRLIAPTADGCPRRGAWVELRQPPAVRRSAARHHSHRARSPMATTFDSTKTELSKLLEDVVAGKIQLPDFQRGWVWDDEHIPPPTPAAIPPPLTTRPCPRPRPSMSRPR